MRPTGIGLTSISTKRRPPLRLSAVAAASHRAQNRHLPPIGTTNNASRITSFVLLNDAKRHRKFRRVRNDEGVSEMGETITSQEEFTESLERDDMLCGMLHQVKSPVPVHVNLYRRFGCASRASTRVCPRTDKIGLPFTQPSWGCHRHQRTMELIRFKNHALVGVYHAQHGGGPSTRRVRLTTYSQSHPRPQHHRSLNSIFVKF